MSRPAAGPSTSALLTAWTLIVVSVVSWRQGVIFSGGLDPFVVGKAVVAVGGLSICIVLWLRAPARRRVGVLSAVIVAVLVAVSVLGAQSYGEFASGTVLAVRMLILAVSVLLLVAVTPTSRLFSTLLIVMGAVAVVAAATGVPGYLGGGRLDGGAPPLAANELATVALPPSIGAAFLLVRRGLSWRVGLSFVVLCGIVFLTGSRTALAVLALAVILVMLSARPLSRGVTIVVLLGLPVLYAVVAFTDVVAGIVSRGEDLSKLLTLNSRTIAWEVVLTTPQDSWAWWIGRGLQAKQIAVPGQYWDDQVLDSSWISVLAQAGVIGTVLLALLVVLTLVFALRSRGLRGLAVPLVVLLALRGFLENGLLDTSTVFTVFFLIAVCFEPDTGRELVPVASRAPTTDVRLPRRLSYPASWLSRNPVPSPPVSR